LTVPAADDILTAMDSTDQAANAPTKTLVESILRDVRADILSCRYPPGGKLSIEKLRANYGVSVGPVREALCRLTAQGFVVAEGQRGFRVADAVIGELIDVTKNRIWVEAMALRSSFAHGTIEWEAQLIAADHRLRAEQVKRDREALPEASAEWESAHRAFHFALISACGSELLIRYRAQLIDMGERYRRLAARQLSQVPGRGGRTPDHAALFDAALARDANRAVEVIEHHLIGNAGSAIEAILGKEADVTELIAKLSKDVHAGLQPAAIVA
jgi:GntR family transcriptional regulator, carbon starvation induced regulator